MCVHTYVYVCVRVELELGLKSTFKVSLVLFPGRLLLISRVSEELINDRWPGNEDRFH